MRLDRLLSQAAGLTRNEARKLIKSALVSVNKALITDPAEQADEGSFLCLDGSPLDSGWLYLMMNKPVGLLTPPDSRQATVMSASERLLRLRCMPVGRPQGQFRPAAVTTDGNWPTACFPRSGKSPRMQALVSGYLRDDRRMPSRGAFGLKTSPRSPRIL